MEIKDFKKAAEAFVSNPPYKIGDYSGKNWGHKWHSLCSYQGKLKPAISYFLIDSFTKKGDVVLDPLCGVGTIPFEACLNGRIGIGNDLSRLAYVVSNAKLKKPEKEKVFLEIANLKKYIDVNIQNTDSDYDLYKDWGFNGKLIEYYEEQTFREILCARNYFKQTFEKKKNSGAYCFVFSCCLHILHGNRPYALSRNSHPLTPYYPKGEFIYKNLIEHVIEKTETTFKNAEFPLYQEGDTYNLDFNKLPSKMNGTVDAVITSPPFAHSIRFYINNWLRLWFAGWEPKDFKEAGKLYLDEKQNDDFDVYVPFFKRMHCLLKEGGIMVLHLGRTKKINMAEELSKRLSGLFEIVFIGEENVDDVEHHGIKDKGGTYIHQFMFLVKK